MSDGLKIVISADIQDFNKDLDKTSKAVKKFGNNIEGNIDESSRKASFALTSLSRVAQDLPFGFVAIQNNLPGVFESFGQLSKEAGGPVEAIKQLVETMTGPEGIAFAATTVITVLSALYKNYGSLSGAYDTIINSTKELTEEQKRFNEIYKSSINSTASEATNITALVAVLNNELETRERKNAALDELKSLNSVYFGSLKNENGLIQNLNVAYRNYIDNLFLTGKSKAAQKQIEDLFVKLLEVERNLKTNELEPVVNPDSARRIKAIEDQLSSLGYSIGDVLKMNITEVTPEINKLITAWSNLKQGIRTIDIDGVTEELNKQKETIISQIIALQSYINTFDTKLPKKEIEDLNYVLRDIATIMPFEGIDTSAKNLEIAVSGIIPTVGELNKTVTNFGINAKKNFNDLANIAINNIQNIINPLVDGLFNAFEKGQNILKSFGNAVKNVLAQLAATLVKTAILAAIITALSGGTGGIATGLGKAGFGTSFGGNVLKLLGFGGAAAPTIGSAGGLTGGLQLGGQVVFVQRGYDLVGVLNAANGSIRNIG